MTTKMKLLAAIAGVGALAILAAPSNTSAATLEIGYSLGAGPVTWVQVTSGTFSTTGGTQVLNSPTIPLTITLAPNLTLTNLTALSQNGTFGGTRSQLLTNAIEIDNNTGGTQVVHIFTSEDFYNLPSSSPLNVQSTVSATVLPGGSSVSGTVTAAADAGNNLLPQSGSLATVEGALAGLTLNLAPQAVTPVNTVSGVFNWNVNTPPNAYSLASEITVNVSAGTSVQIQDQIQVTAAPLPATASMGLGLFGVIGAVGGLNALRRRRATAL